MSAGRYTLGLFLILLIGCGDITTDPQKGNKSKPEPQPASQLEDESGTTPGPESEPEVEPTPDPTPDPTTDPTPDPVPDPEPDPTPDPLPDPEPDPTPDPSPDPEPDPTPEPEPNPIIPPVVTITSAPESITNTTSATFLFTADKDEVTFICKLDDNISESCISPFSISDLSDGTHTFTVSGKDSADNMAVPASYSWTIAVPVECESGTFCITTTTLDDGNISEVYEQQLTVQGGSGVGYTWKITGGDLPDGLSLDGNNRTLSWGNFTSTGDVDMSASTLSSGDLTEISGIVASRLNPGIFWVMDDSGGGPDIFAIGADGAVHQKYILSNATNHDWEDIAIGPGPDPNKEYLYIGDFGDNGSSRSNYQIIRLEEPTVPASRQDPISVTVETFYFIYPDGSKNCEAMLIDWETSIIYLIQKTSGIGNVYKFPSSLDPLWDSAHPTTLIRIDAGQIVSGEITGADASRDSERIIVRQYSNIWEYARPYGQSFDIIFNQIPAAVGSGTAKNQQYEAICYSSDGKDIYTITEKAGSPTVPIYKSEAAPGSVNSIISGTPTENGTHMFTVQVKDSAGNVTTRDLWITIH
jgi:hypothetical protein